MEPSNNDNDNRKSSKSSGSSDPLVFRSAKLSGSFQPVLISQPEPSKSTPQPSISPLPPVQKGWQSPSLTHLGLYYPVGPCQVRISLERLQEILHILQNTFRNLSLQSIYQDKPIVATCKSLEQVEFQVSLHASRTNAHEVIVEIDRKDGDVFSYHKYACHVMRAISGNPDPVGLQRAVPCVWNQNLLEQADSIVDATQPIDDTCIVDALESTWNMLLMDRLDARRLGMESLVHMTDPNKCGLSVAQATAQVLLYPTNDTQERVSKGLFHYACQDMSSLSAENRSYSAAFGVMASDFCYLALVVVCQIFQVASMCQTVDMESFLNSYSDDLVERILEKVHQVHSHPHHAYYAVQTLVALCDSIPSLRSRINSRDVEEAQYVGDSCHLALATVANKLLLTLQA